MNRKKWIIAACIVAALVVSSSLAIHFYNSPPDPSKMTSQQIMDYAKSEDFNNLPREQRGEFFRQAMDSRVNNYFSTPPEERTKYLDKVIDEMGAMRNQRPPQMRDRRPPDPNMFQRFRNAKPSERRAMRESRDPEQSARQRMFFNALRQRAQERGIQMPGRGGGRGGPR
ncbi:MAG: hypothetical protein A2178_01180 [Planctomycetes bacterium GWC2_49_10]|nr:MAG: hypothetical protein A2178_01180 [Planctomycetes bacterium GWC2_49_10]